MKKMLVVEIERCVGCKSCEVACAVEHSVSKELSQAIWETPRPRARVSVNQGSKYAVPLQCRHCEDAPCMAVCPTSALHRANADSPVVLDSSLCIGCTWCVQACPFGVITLDEASGVAVKCDQCFERVSRGALPACVSACPTQALGFESAEAVAAGKRSAYLLQIEQAAAGGAE